MPMWIYTCLCGLRYIVGERALILRHVRHKETCTRGADGRGEVRGYSCTRNMYIYIYIYGFSGKAVLVHLYVAGV
jgi:hypothetical protein